MKSGEGDLAQRLKAILEGLNQVIAAHGPLEVAVEKVFVNVNPQSTLALGQARGTAIHTFAREVASGALRLDAARELDEFVAQLVALPGIGPWTAHYLAMRALHVPDAFPAADLGVQKALARIAPTPGRPSLRP